MFIDQYVPLANKHLNKSANFKTEINGGYDYAVKKDRMTIVVYLKHSITNLHR